MQISASRARKAIRALALPALLLALLVPAVAQAQVVASTVIDADADIGTEVSGQLNLHGDASAFVPVSFGYNFPVDRNGNGQPTIDIGQYGLTADGAWRYVFNPRGDGFLQIQALPVGESLTLQFDVNQMPNRAEIPFIPRTSLEIVITRTSALASARVIGRTTINVNSATGPGTEVGGQLTLDSGASSFLAVPFGYNSPVGAGSADLGQYGLTAGGAWRYVLNPRGAGVSQIQALSVGQSTTLIFHVTQVPSGVRFIDRQALEIVITRVSDITNQLVGSGEIRADVTFGADNERLIGQATLPVVAVRFNSLRFQRRATTMGGSTGDYGGFGINANGRFQFELNPRNERFREVLELGDGDTLLLEYAISYVRSDNVSVQAFVHVTIQGVTERVTGPRRFSFNENDNNNGSNSQASGVLDWQYGDVIRVGSQDANHANPSGQFGLWTPVTMEGTYGRFFMDSSRGNWRYIFFTNRDAVQNLQADAAPTDRFTIAPYTDHYETVEFVFTINGRNDNPVITVARADQSMVRPGEVVQLTGAATDRDFGEQATLAYAWGVTPAVGTFADATDPNTTWTAPATIHEEDYVLTLRVRDVSGGSTIRRVRVNGNSVPQFSTRYTPPAYTFRAGDGVNSNTAALPVARFGDAPLQYRLTPALPPGLSLDDSNDIFGTPLRRLSARTYTWTVTDANGDTDAMEFTITVETPGSPRPADGLNYIADPQSDFYGQVSEVAGDRVAEGRVSFRRANGTDIDRGVSDETVNGQYGTLTITDPQGDVPRWSYRVDHTNSDVLNLPRGVRLRETINPACQNSPRAGDPVLCYTILIDIIGVNQPPRNVRADINTGASRQDPVFVTAISRPQGSVLQLRGRADDRDTGETATLTYIWSVNPTTIGGAFADRNDPNTTYTVGTRGVGATYTLTLLVRDQSGGSASDTVTVTGIATTGLLTGQLTDSVDFGAGETEAGGTLGHQPDLTSHAGATLGEYGTFRFVFDAIGREPGWNWAASSDRLEPVPDGVQVVDRIIVYPEDESIGSAEVTVTITGANDPPVADTQRDGLTVVAGETISVDGGLSFDPDDGETETLTYAWSATPDTAGSFEDRSARVVRWTAPNPRPAAGFIALRLTVTDVHGASDDIIANITITPADPAITGDLTGAVTEDDANADTDTGALQYINRPATGGSDFSVPTPAGQYGSLAITTAGVWTYTLDNADPDTEALRAGEVVTETIAVRAGTGATSTTGNVNIAVTGANDLPVVQITAPATNMTLSSGASVTLTATASDVDAHEQPLRFSWFTDPGGQGVFRNPGALTTTWTAPAVTTTTMVDVVFRATDPTGARSDGSGGARVSRTITVNPVTATTTSRTIIGAGRISENTDFGNDNQRISGTFTDPPGTIVYGSRRLIRRVTVDDGSSGDFGFFAYTPAGVWTFELDPRNAAFRVVNELRQGETLALDYPVDARINGAPQAPVGVTRIVIEGRAEPVTGPRSFTLNEDQTTAGGTNVRVTGQLNWALGGLLQIGPQQAVDNGNPAGGGGIWTPGTMTGAYGRFEMQDTRGNWNYLFFNGNARTQALQAGDAPADQFTIAPYTDLYENVVFQFTIRGANDPPVMTEARADRAIVRPGEVVQLSGAATDLDNNEQDSLVYTWLVSPAAGAFADRNDPNTTWTAPDPLVEAFYTLSLRVRDQNGAADTISVRINGDTTPQFRDRFTPMAYTFQGNRDIAGRTAPLPAATGGDGALTYFITPGLPPGVTFDSGARELGGRPLARKDFPGEPNTFTYRVADANGDTDTMQFTITIVPDFASDPAQPSRYIGGTLTGRVRDVSGERVARGIFGPRLPNGVAAAAALPPDQNQDGVYGALEVNGAQWTYRLERTRDVTVNLPGGGRAFETFTLSAVDRDAYPDATLTIEVIGANDAPDATAAIAVGSPPAGLAGTAIQVVGTGADDDTGDAAALSYAWSVTPTALGGSFSDRAARETTYFVGNRGPGSVYTLTLRVTDTAGASATDTLTIREVSEGNLLTGDLVVRVSEDGPPSISGTVSHPLNTGTMAGAMGTLTVTAGSSSQWVYTLGAAAQALAENQEETDTFLLTPVDTNIAGTNLVITVVGANDAPEVRIVAPTGAPLVAEGRAIALDATATDVDANDRLIYQWSAAPDLGTFADPTALDTTWNAPAVERSFPDVTLTLTVSDGGTTGPGGDLVPGRLSGTAQVVIGLTLNTNVEPSHFEQIPVQNYFRNLPVNVTLPRARGGNGSLTYELVPVPAGLTLDPVTRVLSGTPTTLIAADSEDRFHIYRVTDEPIDDGSTADVVDMMFVITVGEDPGAPTFEGVSVANESFAVGQAVNLTLPEASNGFAPLRYALFDRVIIALGENNTLPPGLSFDSDTRTLSGTPEEPRRMSGFTYEVTDAAGRTAKIEGFIFEIGAIGFAGAIPDQTYAVGVPLATGEGAGALPYVQFPVAVGGSPPFRYAITPDVPQGLSFDRLTRRLSGTPTGEIADTQYTYRVTDSDNTTATLEFRLAVEAPSPYFPAATRAAFAQTYTVGRDITPLTLPAATGGDGNLTYALGLNADGSGGLPDGLTFTAGTRILSGNPDTVQEQTRYFYVATDTDGDRSPALSVDIVIEEERDSAPVFAADEADVADQVYTITRAIPTLVLPQATGGNGELTYTLTLRQGGGDIPAGLTFNDVNQSLSGTPTALQAAMRYDYTVTDSDATDPDSATIIFRIAVLAVPTITFSGTNIGDVTEDAAADTATGTLTITNPGTGGTDFVAQTDASGIYGAFTIVADTGVWTYTLDNADDDTNALPVLASVADEFTVVASAESNATHTVTIIVNGANDAPTAVISAPAAGAEFAFGATIPVTASGEDPDTGELLSFAWRTEPPNRGSFANPAAAATTWTAPASGAGAVTLALEVGDGNITVTERVTINPPGMPVATISPTALPEATLNGAELTVTLTDATYADPLPSRDLAFTLTLATGATGISLATAVRDSPTTATLTLAYDGSLVEATGNRGITVTVLDAAYSGSGDLVTDNGVQVTIPDTAPDFGGATAAPPATYTRAETVNLTLPAANGGNGVLSYTLVGRGSANLAALGLTFNGAVDSRALTGDVSNSAPPGINTFDYTVVDEDGNRTAGDSAQIAFVLTIEADHTPQFTTGQAIANQAWMVRVPVNLTLPEADGTSIRPGNHPFIYAFDGGLASLPPGISFDPVARVLSGAPSLAAPAITLRYRAQDRNGTFNARAEDVLFEVTITDPTLRTVTAAISGSDSLTLAEADLDGTTLTFTLANGVWRNPLPGDRFTLDLTDDPTTDVITLTGIIRVSDTVATLTLDYGDAGDGITENNAGIIADTELTVRVNGLAFEGGGTTLTTNPIAITATDNAPTFAPLTSVPSLTVFRDATVNLTLPAATGGDGGLTYSLIRVSGDTLAAIGLTFDGATRLLSGTVFDSVAFRTHTFNYRAVDADTTSAPDQAQIPFAIITEEDTEPTFTGVTIPDLVVTDDKTITPVTFPPAVSGNGELTYEMPEIESGAVPGLTFNANTRTISGDANDLAVSTRELRYIVEDRDGDRKSVSFDLTVEADSIPSFDDIEPIAAQTYPVGETITALTLGATGGNRVITYTLGATPALHLGLTFNAPANAGTPPTITGTPTTAAAARTYTLTATDEDADAATATFTITIVTPAILVATITDPTTTLAEADLDGATLTVTLANTQYENTLAAGQFTLTLSGGASGISVGSVTRDSATAATLTLAYDDADGVTADTTIAVTVADAAHIGRGALTTANPIAVTATPLTFTGADVPAALTFFRSVAVNLTLPPALGGAPPVTYALDGIESVSGLAFNRTSRVISGTPSVTTSVPGVEYLADDSAGGSVFADLTITVVLPPVQAATITSPATLALDEADLQGAALTVTLTNTEYETPLAAGQFTLTLSGGATGISVGSVTRDSATAATLTLAYDAAANGVTGNTTIAVTVTPAAHTGAGDLITGNTVAVTATEAPDVPGVRNNDSPLIAVNTNVAGVINGSNDFDAYRVLLNADDTYELTVTPALSGAVLEFYTFADRRRAPATRSDGEPLRYTAMSFGVHFVRVGTGAAADGTYTLRVARVQRLVQTATITTPATLDEADLQGAALTVTLVNTEYETSLAAGQFTLTLTGGASGISVGSVNRDSATAATLTLAYDDPDGVTADTTIAVTVADAAHTGSGALTTANTVAVTATPLTFTGVTIPPALTFFRGVEANLTLPPALGGVPPVTYALDGIGTTGLAFDGSTRVISGTPNTVTSLTVDYEATDSASGSAFAEIAIVVLLPPVQAATITSPATLALDEADLQGAALTVTLTNTEYETPLEAGQFTLTLSGGATGISVGSVTRDSATAATLTLAYDAAANGVTGNTTIAVTVTPAAHTGAGDLITGNTVAVTGTLTFIGADVPAALTFFRGVAVNLTLPEAIGGVPPITYALDGIGTTGLAFDGSTRVISGTPNTVTSLTVDYEATDSASGSAFAEIAIIVLPPPVQAATITSPATLALDEADLQGAALTVTLTNTEYENTLTAGQFTLTLSGGASGISVESVNRDSATAATLTLAYDAAADGVTGNTTIAVTVTPAAHTGTGDLITGNTVAVTGTLTFTGADVPAALTFFRGVAVNLTLPEAIGGVPPITYALDGIGTTGLAFDGSTRVISGTPNTVTSLTVDYEATDSASGSAFAEIAIVVLPPPVQAATITSPATLALDEADLQGAALTVTLTNTEYENTLTAGQFTLTLSGGASGISVESVNRDSATAATLTLAYDAAADGVTGNTTIAVTVTPAAHTGTGDLITGNTVAVTGTLTFTGADVPAALTFFRGVEANLTLPPALGGVPPVTYALDGIGTTGLAFDGSTRVISGTPNTVTSLTVDYEATDSASGSAFAEIAIVVLPPPVQAATITSPATLALDEADLQGAALTVTLTNTEYENTLTAGQFTLTLSGGASGISVESVNRDSATAATLTLAYDAAADGVTGNTTIAVTVTPAAHTGTGDLITGNTVAVTGTLTFTGADVPAALTFFRGVAVNLTLPEAIGGVPPITYALDGIGTTGLAFDGSTRVISGTPNTVTSLTVDYEATDSASGSAFAEIAIIVLLPPVQAATITSPATLALDEADLQGAALTVTLTNTEYETPLAAGQFTLTLTGGATGISVASVNRDSATAATLTLAYGGTGVDADTTIAVTVADAAHTGAGNLITPTTVAVTATPAPVLSIAAPTTNPAGPLNILSNDSFGLMAVVTNSGNAPTVTVTTVNFYLVANPASAPASVSTVADLGNNQGSGTIAAGLAAGGGIGTATRSSIFGPVSGFYALYACLSTVTAATLATECASSPLLYDDNVGSSATRHDVNTGTVVGPRTENGASTATISHIDDSDWFSFILENGALYRIDLTSVNATLLNVRDNAGAVVSRDLIAGGGNTLQSATYTAAADGRHFIEVVDNGGGIGRYTLVIRRLVGPVPELSIAAAPVVDTAANTLAYTVTNAGTEALVSAVAVNVVRATSNTALTGTALTNALAAATCTPGSGAAPDPCRAVIDGDLSAPVAAGDGTTDGTLAQTITALITPSDGVEYYYLVCVTVGADAACSPYSAAAATDIAPDFGAASIGALSYPATAPITPLTLPIATGGNGELAYRIVETLPTGLTFDNAMRALSGAPATMAAIATFTYTVGDADTNTAGTDEDTLSFMLTIVEPATFDSQPFPNPLIAAGRPFSLTLPEAGGGVGQLVYSVDAGIGTTFSGLAFDPATRVVSGTQATVPAGDGRIALDYRVTDETGDVEAFQPALFLIVEANTRPAFTEGQAIANMVYTVNRQIAPVTFPAADFDAGSNLPLMHFFAGSSNPPPSGLTFDQVTRELSGTPDTVQAGTNHIYRVFDRDNEFNIVAQDITFTTTIEAESMPNFTGVTTPNLTLTVGKAITDVVLPEANDGNGMLTYALPLTGAAGLAFDAGTRTISGTPTFTTTVTAEYTATDRDGDVVTASFTIATEADSIPTYTSIPAQEYIFGTLITPLDVGATGGNRSLTYTLDPALPDGLTFNAGLTPPTITGTPTTPGDAISYTVTATDEDGSSASTSFAITILGPEASITAPASLRVDEVDLNGATVTVTLTHTEYASAIGSADFSLAGENGFVTIGTVSRDSATTATLSLVYGSGGDFTSDLVVTIMVLASGHTNSGALATTNTLTLVATPDFLPTFGTDTINPQTYTVGTAFSVTLPEASDGDPPLTYTLTPALPDGLTFDNAADSRILSGTPVNLQDELAYTYTATDSDTTDPDSATLQFTITIVAPATDLMPTFGSRTIGDLDFTVDTAVSVELPEATGGDGALTHAISSGTLPTGMSFDDGTRILEGTPTVVQASTAYTYTATDSDNGTITADTNPDSVNLDFTITIAADIPPTFGAATIPDQTYTAAADVGTVTLPTATGGNRSLTYTLDPALPANLAFDGTATPPTITGIPAVETASATYTYTATDEDGDPISLTFALLIGPQPVIISGAGAINENTDTASGSLTITNRNIGGSILIDALDADGDYGSISIDTAGGWTYTLDNTIPAVNLLTTGGSLMDTFTVTATAPPLVTHDLVITINGFNDAPVAEITVPASAIQVSHGAVRDVTGTATDVDDDNSGLTLAWSAVLAGTSTAAGSFVNADMATATWTAPTMDATVTLTFSASDGATTTESTVTVTVTPVSISFTGTSNFAGTVTEDGTLTAGGTVTATNEDDDTNPAITPQTTTRTYGTFTIAADGIWTYTLDNADTDTDALPGSGLGATVTETFTVSTVDGGSQTITITVNGANDAPTAAITAPTDGTTVEFGSLVTLTATGADVDNSTLTYAWRTQPAGRGSFADAAAASTTWTAPNSGTGRVTLTLTVTDNDATPRSGTASVTVNPIAVAVTLGGALTGSVTEDNSTTTATGTLTIATASSNQAVIPQSATGTYGSLSITGLVWTYTLDNADVDTNALPAGVIVMDTFTVTASVNPAVSVEITITITGANDPTTVTISRPAAATTGAFNVESDRVLTLRAIGEDPDTGEGRALTFAWTTNPANTGAFADATSPNTTWTAPSTAAGNVTLTLTATASGITAFADFPLVVIAEPTITGNGIGVSTTPEEVSTATIDTDTGMVTDNTGRAAGMLTVSGAIPTDPDDGEPYDVVHTIISQPTYGDVTIDDASLISNVGDFWNYQLDNSREVTRNLGPGDIATDTFTVQTRIGEITIDNDITVTLTATTFPDDRPVIVFAEGPRMTVDEGEEMVTLDASGSYDPENRADGTTMLTFEWTQARFSGTACAADSPPLAEDLITLSGERTDTATFDAPDERTTLCFNLMVTDRTGEVSNDTLTVRVGRASERALQKTLAAFGRAFATGTVGMFEDYLSTPAPTNTSHFTIGGHKFDMATDPAQTSPSFGNPVEHAPTQPANLADTINSANLDGTTPNEANANNADNPADTTTLMSGHDLLMQSAFHFALDDDATGTTSGWSFWGRATTGNFDGDDDDFSIDGDVTSAYLGMDYLTPTGTRLGLAISESSGDIDYADAADGNAGDLEADLTSVLPYIQWQPNDATNAWVMLGYGRGDAELSDASSTIDVDIGMQMFAFGARGDLNRAFARTELSWKASAFTIDLESDREDTIAGVDAAAQRLRLAIEGRRPGEPTTAGGVFTPNWELGMRWDDGDAENGGGADVGLGFNYHNPAHGWSVQGRTTFLLVHAESAYEEWDAGVQARLDPGAQGRGITFTLEPGWTDDGRSQKMGMDFSNALGKWSKRGLRLELTGERNANDDNDVRVTGTLRF